MRTHAYLFGIHARPPQWLAWCYAAMPFVILFAGYMIASSIYLDGQPNGKVFPSLITMGDRIYDLAFTKNVRSGDYMLWADTAASLARIGTGLLFGALVGFLLGVNMALFPGLRHLSLAFVVAISNVPVMALLPLLLMFLGVGDVAKITLIFLGVMPFLTREMYARANELPRELLVKSRTLGATEIQMVYKIACPMLMPYLIRAVQQALGTAWLFLIAAEGIAATEGLGYRIFLVRRYLDNATIIPYVVWITTIAFALTMLCDVVLQVFFPWKEQRGWFARLLCFGKSGPGSSDQAGSTEKGGVL